MSNVLQNGSDLPVNGSLREAAVRALPNSRRGTWLIVLAAAAMLGFIFLLAREPGATLSSPGLGELGQILDQSRQIATGSIPSNGIFPMAYPLWLMLVAKFTNDIAIAARILSGMSAVLALFVAYQLCHGLAHPDRADEQACFALVALALSPTFFQAAAGGATEMPHLALLLLSLLFVQRAVGSNVALASMAMGGLIAGFSVLLRPISLLVLPAVGLWLWWSRPFGADEQRANFRPGAYFGLAFLLGMAPQLVFKGAGQHTPLAWGLSEVGLLLARLASEPLAVLSGAGHGILQYLLADDFERLSAVSGSWQMGDWGATLAALIALSPSVLKLVGLLGLLLLCWLERLDESADRARLPALLLMMLILGGALALLDGRSRLPIETLLVVFAFGGLPSVIPGALGSGLGIALVGLLVLHEVGVGFPAHAATSYRVADLVAVELQQRGSTANQVMSTNWALYDTRSQWKDRYRQVPIYVDSFDSLKREMKRQGATYLVFDRLSGAEYWPQLAFLTDTDRPRPGLTPLGPPIRTGETPPNSIAIYKLE